MSTIECILGSVSDRRQYNSINLTCVPVKYLSIVNHIICYSFIIAPPPHTHARTLWNEKYSNNNCWSIES